ncbi:hypothetical protein C8035_v001118 [Colletotrichum spinosum]|uniref:Myb-like DNA-binding domain-containing protein n=1 Tax=Colletotrichum spinosum TaxID=1347390 RepID=A0A4R8QG27_9PEZI|nr:hypothetical protein C8035_v001118 [Colletotrichum spinosum]
MSNAVGTDAEGTVVFLVSCIRHSSGGKVDFESVSKECNIVSKAAAAKRFERVLKAHGMKTSDLSKPGGAAANSTPSQSPAPKTPAKSASKRTPKSTGKRPAATVSPTSNTKRAKLAASHPAVESYTDTDDEEDNQQFKVKAEDKADNGPAGTALTGSYYDIPFRSDRDDDDLQLLYVLEKTSACPVHEIGENRSVPSVSFSSDTDTEYSMQTMPPLVLSNTGFDFSQLPACYPGWPFVPNPSFSM